MVKHVENILLQYPFAIMTIYINIYFFPWPKSPSRPRPPHYQGFTIILTHITLDRTLLEEWAVRRRDLYLTTHNIHKTQTSIPPAGFEPAIPASVWPQTHALDSVATVVNGKICKVKLYRNKLKSSSLTHLNLTNLLGNFWVARDIIKLCAL